MLLKKHIVGSTLTGVSRLSGDRIIELTFSRSIAAGIRRENSILCEFIGKFNDLVLVDDAGLIIASASSGSHGTSLGSSRLPGNPYDLPDQPLTLSSSQGVMGPVVYYSLTLLPKMGRKLASSLHDRWHLHDGKTWENLILPMTGLEGGEPPLKGCLLQEIGNELSCFGTLLGKPLPAGGGILSILREKSLSALIRSRLESERILLKKEIEKRGKRLTSIERGMANRTSLALKAEDYKTSGDLLLAHSQRIPRGAEKVTLPFWTEKGAVDMVIELDPALSAARNAQNYFRKYRKSRLEDENLPARAKRLEASKRELSGLLLWLDEAETISEIRILRDELKEATDPSPSGRKTGAVREFSFRGFHVLVGTNRKANRKVTFVLSSPEDLWFHARGIPGAHVVLRLSGKTIPPGDVLEFTSSLAAFYSRYSDSLTVAVDYTRRKHVRPVPGTISEVVYSRARTLMVSPGLWSRLLQEKSSVPGEEKP
jgi:predicted ribosome quality control (RQC) complex YloA/Tae2 family protein